MTGGPSGKRAAAEREDDEEVVIVDQERKRRGSRGAVDAPSSLTNTTTTTSASAAAAVERDEADMERQEEAEAEQMEDDEQQRIEEEEEEEELEEYESSSSQSTTTSTLTWITWFCSLPGHEYFCEVAEEFIEDDFNLTGLAVLVPFYREAMEMVLDVEPEDETQRVPDVSIVESSAELLYGLVHQRYIITRQGLQQMFAKYEAGHFGVCPRVLCSSTKLLPCGRSDLPGVDTVKLYCPSCVDMYVPPSSRFLGVDGAFFGTTFAHLLLQTYPGALPFPNSGLLPKPETSATTQEGESDNSPDETTPFNSRAPVYVPKIYGFRVSERAKSGPRMMWLRMRPRFQGEVDQDPFSATSTARATGPSRRGGGHGGSGGPKGGPSKFTFGDEDEDDDEGGRGRQGGPQPDRDQGNQDEEHDEDVGEAMEGVTKAALDDPARQIRALPYRQQQPATSSGNDAHEMTTTTNDDHSQQQPLAQAMIARPPKAVVKSVSEDSATGQVRLPLNNLAVR